MPLRMHHAVCARTQDTRAQDTRARMFPMQRLQRMSAAMHRGNAASILGTIADDDF